MNNSGWSFTNGPAGVINASTGNIFINEPMTNQGLMESTGTGVLQIAVSITNGGEIAPDGSPNPGMISINGNLTQSSSGAEGIFIGGLTAGTQYSQLNVSGTASLNGALDVAFINGFMPASGNQFTVLTAGSITGTFSSINSEALPAGLIWTLTYNPTSVVLTAVPGNSMPQTLTVTDLGSGSGSVTDNLGQINCIDTAGVQSGTCSATYNSGTTVTLTATPVAPATFGGWGGACSGTGGCSVVMNSAQAVTASFVPPPPMAAVPFSCPNGVYPCSNVTAPPAVFNCPSGTNPCTDPNAHSLTLTATQINSPFTLTVVANEVSTTQANGDCQSGQSPATDFDCRFTSFFPYETLPDGDIIVPACDAYSNGNCVFYSVYYETKGNEPPEGDFNGPVGWSIAWNNTSFPPPPGYPYQANNPRLYYDPDYEVSPTTPYGTNCSVPMDINGVPTSPPIYCQFVFDITTYFNPTQPPDAGIGGKSQQFSDLVVAFPLTIAAPNLSVTKTADQTHVNAGSPIGYTVTMSNSSAAGTGSATNVALNDPLPAGSGVNWSISPAYSGQGTCTITGAPPSQTLTCSLGNLSPAISASVHVSSSSSSAGTYVNAATLTADNNPTLSSSATIQVVGGSGAIVSVSPSSINYGVVYLFSTQTAAVTVSNIGSSPVRISNVSLTPGAGTGAGEFTFTDSCPHKLAVGASCTITVSFDAVAVGTPSATLSISDNASGSPQQVSLSATVIDPKARLSTTSLDFSTVPIGQSRTKNVTLSNPGKTALSITSIGITGADPGDFRQSNACPASLVAGKSCTISVTFTPTKTGPRSAELTVIDNAQNSPQNVSLSGKGSE
jgi:uncharacterized repeat protein (TIGR01451 family)